MKKKVDKIICFVSFVLFISTVFYKVTCDDFLLMGYKPYFIASNSMEPCIKTGQLVLGVQVEADELKIGDIAAYELYSEQSHLFKETVIHRIYKVNEDGTYEFKGDNNKNPDIYSVSADRIKYKIVYY